MSVAGRRIVVACTLASAIFATANVNASPSAKLVYVRGAGAEACPTEAELRRAVAVRIGYDPFFLVAQKTVVAQVQRVPNGYRGKLQIVGDDGNLRGERDLATTGDDCNELAFALALAVSIALDDLDEPPPGESPTATVETANNESIAPTPSPTPRPASDTPPSRPSAPSPGHDAELAVSIGPAIAIGTAPGLAEAASIAASLRWPSFALRLDVRGELPASKAMSRGGQVATNSIVATASACLRGRIPFACLGAGSGVLFSNTDGLARDASDAGALLVGAARGGVDLALASWIYLEPFAEVGVNLATPRVAVDREVVHETSRVWSTVGLHLGGRLLL